LGCTASMIANRALATQFFQVEAFDGAILGLASISVLLVALIASYIPARTATRNNISSALKQD
jgi:ABC-type antimicrobial peptide transport system permease subunit